LESWNAANFYIDTANNAAPLVFRINRNERARITDQYGQFSPFGTSAGNTYPLRFLELAANGSNFVGMKGTVQPSWVI
jgi:hypothetical protein